MKKIAGFIGDLFLNFRPSSLAFYGMRITGLALALFLIIHIYSVGHVVESGWSFNGAMAFYDTGLGKFGHWMEFFLFLAVLFHAANGVRVIACDFFSLTRRQKHWLWGTMTVAFIIAIASFPRFVLSGWYW